MTYITEALWAEEPEVWDEPCESESLTEEDFQDDEAARDGCYSGQSAVDDHEYISAADVFDCSEEDLQSTIEYAQNHMEAYER